MPPPRRAAARRAAAALLALSAAGWAAAQTFNTEPLVLDTTGVTGGLSCGDPGMVGKTFKLGYVYMGEIADVGWTYRHNEGRIFAQKMMSSCHPSATFISEFVEWTPKDQSSFDDYAQRNFNLVIATSFKYHDETLQAALEHSGTHFVHVSGFYSCQNMHQAGGWPEQLLARAEAGELQHCNNFITAWGKLYQARYLAGVVAGGTSVTKKIAYVASVPIPEVLRNINSYALGAWKADPNVQVLVMWIFSFFWKDGEREAARRLIELGADVLAYHTDTMEVPVTAHRMGKMSVGSNGDVRRLVGESVLTSAYFNWGPLYKDLVNMSISGVFQSSDLWYDYFHGVITNAENSFRVSDATSQLFLQERARLAVDKWDPFDQSDNGGLSGGCAFSMGPDGPTCNDPSFTTADADGNLQARCGVASGVCSGSDIEGTQAGGTDLSFFPGRIVHDFLLEGIVTLLPFDSFGTVCVPGTWYEEHIDAATNHYSIECHDCAAGYFSDFDNYPDPAFFCCEIENHPNATGAPTCTGCPAGMTTNGLTKQRACVECEVDTYTPNAVGSPQCSACPTERTNLRQRMSGDSVEEGCPVCASGYQCDDGSNATTACMTACVLIPDVKVEDNKLAWIIPTAIAGFLIFIVGPGLLWKFTKNARRMRLLYNNNTVAESCAESIAAMRLEEVHYIKEIPDPNRIQRAFMSIVDTLEEYRRYLPATVLAGVGGDEGCGSENEFFDEEDSGQDAAANNNYSTADLLQNNESPQAGDPTQTPVMTVPEGWVAEKGAEQPRVPIPGGKPFLVSAARPGSGQAGSRAGSKGSVVMSPGGSGKAGRRAEPRASMMSRASAGTQRGRGPRPSEAVREEQKQRLAAQLDVGFRERKGAVVCAEADLGGSVAQGAFNTGSQFAAQCLQAVHLRDGLPLELRADAVLATWNSHRPCPRYALQSALAAVAVNANLVPVMARNVQAAARWWCVSCAAGVLSVGHVGDSKNRAPFVMGRAAQQVRCLGGLSRHTRVRALATQHVQEMCQSRIDFLPIDVVPSDHLLLQEDPTGDLRYDIVVFEVRGELDMAASMGGHAPPFRASYNRAWAHLRAPRPDYKRVMACLEEAVAHDPDDRQGVRLLHLATMGMGDQDALPTPYHRDWVGWDPYEKACAGVELSDAAAAAVRRRRRSSTRSPKRGAAVGRLTEEQKKKEDTERLRDEIERARQTRVRRASSCSTDSPDPGGAPGDFPPDFTDRDGSRWYRAAKKLGAGGFGEVWLGMSEDGGLVALKLLPLPAAQKQKKVSRLRPQLAAQQGGQDKIDELLQEVRLMADLQHDNIVQVMSSAVVSGSIVVVMEFVPGGSLQTVLDQFGKLPVSSLKRYARDSLRGLHFLHSRGVVHRDIKPANVLLQIDGACKLADFGAAAELSAAAEGSTLGTPMYMAPEACRGHAEKKSDIWSFGISWFQLAVGVLPWAKMDTMNRDDTQPTAFSAGAMAVSSPGDGTLGGATTGGGGVIQFMRKIAKDESMAPVVSTADVPHADLNDFIMAGLKREASERPSCDLLLVHAFLQ